MKKAQVRIMHQSDSQDFLPALLCGSPKPFSHTEDLFKAAKYF